MSDDPMPPTMCEACGERWPGHLKPVVKGASGCPACCPERFGPGAHRR